MHSDIKLRITSSGLFCFGPGVYSLLTSIEKCGSVSQGANDMHLSYSKAWKIIHESEEGFGFLLVTRHSGGKGGGKAEITNKGKKVMEAYREWQEEVKKETEISYKKYFSFLEEENDVVE